MTKNQSQKNNSNDLEELKNFFNKKFEELSALLLKKDLIIEKLEQRVQVLEEKVSNDMEIQEKEKKRTEVVLLRSQIKEATALNIIGEANNHLQQQDKITASEILSISDYRHKKGPIVIKLATMTSKFKLLKCKDPDFLIKNSLTKNQSKIKKIANAIKQKGVISKVWEYKGDIYFQRTGMEERIRGSISALKRVEEEDPDFAPNIHG